MLKRFEVGMSRVLIDTGAIYAFVVKSDIHHQAAREFTLNFLAQGGSFVLLDWVFAETMTLLKARLGSKIALGEDQARFFLRSTLRADGGGSSTMLD
jgi:predicted nucleic acid-binding protein